MLGDVQAICFQSALRRIPVVLINPVLISTSYSTFGPTTAMLVGDFTQAYFIRDDYVMLAQSGRWCGLVRRLKAGCDLYLLEQMTSTASTATAAAAVQKSTRLMHWETSTPDNLRSQVARLIAGEFNYAKNIQKQEQAEKSAGYNAKTGARGHHSTKPVDDSSSSSAETHTTYPAINLSEFLSATERSPHMVESGRRLCLHLIE